jgi:hypothetical protein
VTRIAFLLTVALLAGCGEAPLPVAQADEVYASIRRAEAEQARARPGSPEKASEQSAERGIGKSQL